MANSPSDLSRARPASTSRRGSAPRSQSKVEWLLEEYFPEMPTFPLDAELMAEAPEDLTGEWPESDEDLDKHFSDSY